MYVFITQFSSNKYRFVSDKFSYILNFFLYLNIDLQNAEIKYEKLEIIKKIIVVKFI